MSEQAAEKRAQKREESMPYHISREDFEAGEKLLDLYINTPKGGRLHFFAKMGMLQSAAGELAEITPDKTNPAPH